MSGFIDWSGFAGSYRYWFLEDNSPRGIKNQPGNYAFVRLAVGGWLPVYFGQAVDLQSRIPSHETWLEAMRLGASRIMGHVTLGGEAVRIAEERDLIAWWNPPCNVHHRTDPWRAAGSAR